MGADTDRQSDRQIISKFIDNVSLGFALLSLPLSYHITSLSAYLSFHSSKAASQHADMTLSTLEVKEVVVDCFRRLRRG